MHSLMKLIHGTDIYDGFTGFAEQYPDLTIEAGHPVFERLIEESRPRVVIDVNNDDGSTAILLAELLKRRGLDSIVVAVNPFLDNQEDMASLLEDKTPPHVDSATYKQFMNHVIKHNLQDRIIPFPVSSLVAGRILGKAWVKVDMVHLDVSREEQDMQFDLLHYEPMLSDVNAVLCGGHHSDTAPNLMNAVNKYSEAAVLALEMMDDKWILWK